MWFDQRIAALIAGLMLVPPVHAAEAPGAEPASSPPPAHPVHRRSALEQRLEILTRELQLSSAQQAEVRKILIRQQMAVRQVWSNSTIDPLERAAATQSVTEHTGDAIREVLTEEQKKKYNTVKPDMPVEAGSRRSVEDWMQQMGAH